MIRDLRESLDAEIARTKRYLMRLERARVALEPESHNGRRRASVKPRTEKLGRRRRVAVTAR